MYQIIKGNSIEEINETLSEMENVEWIGDITVHNQIQYNTCDGSIYDQWMEYYLSVKFKEVED